MKNTKEPFAYLSKSKLGWTLIRQGFALCAHTDKSRAIRCAEHFRVILPECYFDATTGAFVREITYTTPVGTFDTWEDAAAACERCDYDPTLCITINK